MSVQGSIYSNRHIDDIAYDDITGVLAIEKEMMTNTVIDHKLMTIQLLMQSQLTK